jgi:hypothetical protein
LRKERLPLEKLLRPLVADLDSIDAGDLGLLAQSMFAGLHPREIDYAVTELQQAAGGTTGMIQK